MAIFGKYYNCFLSVGGTTISTRLKSCTVSHSIAMLDATVMGSTTKVNATGIRDWSIQCEGVDGIGATELDTILWALFDAGAAFAIIFRPDTAARGAANPEFTGSGVLASCPIGGAHGALLSKSFTINSASALARSVTP